MTESLNTQPMGKLKPNVKYVRISMEMDMRIIWVHWGC